MSEPRYICIHGHFYQPPRENPWLEVVEVQDSAAPSHDWNERVHKECYGPNTRARMLARDGRIRRVVNNYESISFNFGPTLLAWMEQAMPEDYAAILAADARSVTANDGHGNAIAQVYNHTIMPLQSAADKAIQIEWGIADFEHRFRRKPEGMWLAETAADVATLEALAAAGIRFTVLAPRQAWQVCDITDAGQPDGAWHDVGDAIDPTQAYRCFLPSGASIDLFFYDGPISQAVAFEGLLADGKTFAERLTSGFDDARTGPQLMHIATDGESYGHHHRHGEMALASAIENLASRGYAPINYGRFLALHPPRRAVRIGEPSSWSCAHGVERWRSDCGCADRADWSQAWRGPLRAAFDMLRGRIDALFAEHGERLFRDVDGVRREYVQLILDRSTPTRDRFLATHLRDAEDPGRRAEALELLELHRHGQYLYTSCAWFFSEISGLEGVQNMMYAARVIQLARLFGVDLEPDFLRILRDAPSNIPSIGNGAVAYRKLVQPAVMDFPTIAAHYAVLSLFDTADAPTASGTISNGHTAHGPNGHGEIDPRRVYTFECEMLRHERRTIASRTQLVGHIRVRNRLTELVREFVVALLHFGSHDIHCAVRHLQPGEDVGAFVASLSRSYESDSLATTLRAIDIAFDEGRFFSLEDLVLEDRRRVLHLALSDNIHRFRDTYTRLYEENRALMQQARALNIPVSRPYAVATEFVLTQRLLDWLPSGVERGHAVEPLLMEPALINSVQGALVEAAHWQVELTNIDLERAMRAALEQHVTAIGATAEGLTPQAIEPVDDLIDACRAVGIDLSMRRLQNAVYDLLADPNTPARLQGIAASERAPLMTALHQLIGRLQLDPGLLDPLQTTIDPAGDATPAAS